MTHFNVQKTHDQTVFGTTLVTDNELQFPAEANSVWGVHFDLLNSADDVDDLNGRVQFAVTAPSGSTVTAYLMTLVGNGTNAPTQGPLTPASQGTPGSWMAFGAPGTTVNPAYAWVRIACKVTLGSTPSQVGLQFAEYANVSDSVGTTVFAGSSMFATKG